MQWCREAWRGARRGPLPGEVWGGTFLAQAVTTQLPELPLADASLIPSTRDTFPRLHFRAYLTHLLPHWASAPASASNSTSTSTSTPHRSDPKPRHARRKRGKRSSLTIKISEPAAVSLQHIANAATQKEG
ncbi:hypothetical protein E2C01_082924 [Portunus trituberculatus]|uniref:Uncharacterized protein n=1 Tax=Portunus trituberculatus TaxID=210409 RepID=A0A5B7IZS1_PORTR|nr:hypothetical protein [Portunus trituberculatus]